MVARDRDEFPSDGELADSKWEVAREIGLVRRLQTGKKPYTVPLTENDSPSEP
ncbi:MAG: hypothetical protein PHC60_01235 [Heliobacteriaceae bacterium]|nr:hypothetical protein [Heliobacteriaceae bacterium]MDD4586998.1 hypothetical protein [Heliobacteriaceae bacterium]